MLSLELFMPEMSLAKILFTANRKFIFFFKAQFIPQPKLKELFIVPTTVFGAVQFFRG